MNKHATQTAPSGPTQAATPNASNGNGSVEPNGRSHNGQAHDVRMQTTQPQTRAMAKSQPDRRLHRPVSWGDPYTMMQQLADEMDAIFDGFGLGRSPLSGRWRPGYGPTASLASANWLPPVEVEERDGKLLVRADLPGLKKEDVRVRIEDDVLTLSGERRQQQEEDREGFYHSERSYGSFQRSIPLPGHVNPDQAQATFRDGVLEVTLPAPEPETARGRQISIQS